jgi:hypothetical protein
MLPGGLTYGEITHRVAQLGVFTPDKVGTQPWKTQRMNVELFNIISHQCAQRKADDFVLSELVSCGGSGGGGGRDDDHYDRNGSERNAEGAGEGKMPVLVGELLVAEAMRNNVYAKVLDELAAAPAGVYLYLQYESVLVNLLQVLLYHEEAVTALGDTVVDLIDYAWGTVRQELLSGKGAIDAPAYHPEAMQADDAKAGAAAPMLDPRERLYVQVRELQIRRAMMCISLLWFIIERMPVLPLAASNAILSKHDLVVGLAALIERQPWTLTRGSQTYKFKADHFGRIDAAGGDALVVVIPEAHAWFALHYLLCDRACRTRYQYNRFRKDQVMRIKKYLHEVTIDQLPVLVDLQRLVEELSFMEPPAGTEEKFRTSMLLIETVSPRQSFLHAFRGWDDIVRAFKGGLLTHPDTARQDATIVSEIIDWMQLDGDEPAEAAVAAPKKKGAGSSDFVVQLTK